MRFLPSGKDQRPEAAPPHSTGREAGLLPITWLGFLSGNFRQLSVVSSQLYFLPGPNFHEEFADQQ